jgi:hypothetical protein
LQEGVDYPLRRPTKLMSSGGGGSGAFGKALALVANDKAPSAGSTKPKPTGADGKPPTSAAPEPPKPVEIPTEDILVKKPELLSIDEARAIVFARGELKGEGSIDGVMD